MGHLLAALRAEPSTDGLPGKGGDVDELAQRSAAVLDLDLVLLDDQVDGGEAAGHLAAVGAVADVAAPAGEELAVVDGDVHRAAEAVAPQARLKGGRIVLLRVARQSVHGCARWLRGWGRNVRYGIVRCAVMYDTVRDDRRIGIGEEGTKLLLLYFVAL
jgi:hypothetical protein